MKWTLGSSSQWLFINYFSQLWEEGGCRNHVTTGLKGNCRQVL